ncbi:MAG: T9SS type A sorting domain-containing protein [Flavobacteriales bacterium]|nr:T9SS type A sorting domain-containing protein [Flavobacteriales bacterium]
MHRSLPLVLVAIVGTLLCPMRLWAQTFQRMFGDTANEGALAAARTIDGGHVMAGFITGMGVDGEDAYLVRTNAMGELLWTRTYGGPGDERAQGVAATSDGGAVLCGTTNSFGAGGEDILLIRTDAAGDTLWCRTFGDADIDGASAVVQSDDGGFLVCGWLGDLPGNGNGRELHLVRTDANGDTLWTRCFGGIYGDVADAIRKTTDGAYVIAGTTSSFGAGSNDLYLLKVDDAGTLLFSRTYGGPDMDWSGAVTTTADGGYVVAGSSYSFDVTTRSLYLVRTDAVGDTLWTRIYDTGGLFGGLGLCVSETADSGFISGGQTTDVKVNASGDLQWSMTFNASYGLSHSYCEPMPDGGVVFIGTAGSTGLGMGMGDMHMVRTDASGYSHCNEFPIPLGNASTPTQVGNPATTLRACTTVPGAAPMTVGTGGTAVLLCLATSAPDARTEEHLLVVPNPSSGAFTLTLGASSVASIVEVFDARGVCVLRSTWQGSVDHRLDLGDRPAGLYTVLVYQGAEVHTMPLVLDR